MAGPNPSVEMVSCGSAHASPEQILFPDPQRFVAGQIHRHLAQCDCLLDGYPKRQEILGYISHGVKVSEFFVHFKGGFKGNSSISRPLQRHLSPTVKFANSLRTS